MSASEHGGGLHSLQWLDKDGAALAQSDSGDRDKFLSFVSKHRAPRISSHWFFLMKPLVLDHVEEQGVIAIGRSSTTGCR